MDVCVAFDWPYCCRPLFSVAYSIIWQSGYECILTVQARGCARTCLVWGKA